MAKIRYRPEPDRDPVGPFLHYLMAECGVSPHTLAAYRSDLMRFLRWRKAHAPGPLAQMDVAGLSGYVEELGQVRACPQQHLPAPGKSLHVLPVPGFRGEALGQCGQAAGRPGRLGPAADGAGARGGRPAAQAPDAETRLGRRDRAALETLYATGCRASEVVGLRPADLDLKTGLARCVGKGNKERWVPLGSRAIEALSSLPRKGSSGSWFAGIPRRPRSWSRSRGGRSPGSASGGSSSSMRGPPG